MPLQVEGSRIQVLGPAVSSNVMGSIRRTRELSDIAPQYVAKSGLCSASELESSRGGSIRIQHVTGLTNAVEEKSRFPKLDECAHFHYEHVEIGPLQVSLVDDDDLKPLSNQTEEEKWWSLSVTSQNKTWLIRRSYDNFRMLDQQLHRCIYDRKFSELMELPAECIEEQENMHELLFNYVARFSSIAGSLINCGPILNWLELDNRGRRLLVPDTDNCPINTPAVAAAYSVKRYTAQAPDEISFEVGDMISVIDMPPSEESIWWRGKRGFQVGFFPCECVAVIGDKVPRNLHFSTQMSQPSKPVLRKHGKLIAFFRSFILSRPSRRRLKQSGILKERVFGCDLGEHLLNSGHEIPMVLKCCVEFIESNGLVDGIYRLSGVTSNIQKLRNAFDEDRVPALYEDEAILQDVHSVASLLKMYFRELPNPLCTYQLYHHFVGAVQATQGDDTRLLKMRDVVQKLPPPHYRTLEYLMRHLARVSEKGHETGMTSRNVAIVWAPNLLRCKELEVGGVAALQGVGVQAVVTEFLVCYADLIFCDRLPNFSLPPRQVSSKKSRPKSLAISTPTKLLSLEEARNRALRQAAGKVEQDYIEVGGGPANLPAKYHTVIELPGSSRKRMGSKRSPIGWKMLFGKSGRSSQTRKEVENKSSASSDLGLGGSKAVTELDLAQSRRRLRPAKSAESLNSSRNSTTLELLEPPGGLSSLEDALSPMLLRNGEGKGNGHNRSVSHESYFDQFQDQKEDVALDISEIRVNFDLEESEMRIFSEDETLLSVGSGSLASNSSPRIIPGHKSGKFLQMGSVNKRLSYPKLAVGEDSFCGSQSADPSPKKQKINDGVTFGSKLEEQLSSSVGDIQFIDSVSPDQVLVQAEVHPIQSPSPVSSISQMSSSLFAPSSPILPHIPHLQKQSSGVAVHSGSGSLGSDSHTHARGNRSCVSLESNRGVRPVPAVSNETSPHSYLTSPSIAEATISDNESFSLQSSEFTTPDTPVYRSYTPLIDFEESSASNITTPDFDAKTTKSSSETDNLDKAMIMANREFDCHQNIGMEFAKFEEKINSNDSVTCKAIMGTIKETAPPKPEERKPKPVHPYENIPMPKTSQVESGKILETSFDYVERSPGKNTGNRNSVISIRYEAISTESSCESFTNPNKNEESSLFTRLRSASQNSAHSERSTGESSEKTDNDSNEKEDSEMNLLKECSDWLEAKQELCSKDGKNDLSRSEDDPCQDLKTVAERPKESPSRAQSEPPVGVENKEVKECGSFFEVTRPEDLQENSEGSISAVPADSSTLSFEGEDISEGQTELQSEASQKFSFSTSDLNFRSGIKTFETDLDQGKDFEVVVSSKKIQGKPTPKKRTSPQKSNSSGNVRQLLSKFEISPTTEKDLMDLRLDLDNRLKKKGEKSISREEDVRMVEVRKGIQERPKTLERLSTKRKTEKDASESLQVQIEKSKSGSHIDEKRTDGVLLNYDFDLSDPQRRERIEKYKEKRRNYLREKYRSDSFKTEKEEYVLKIKTRHASKSEEVDLQLAEKMGKNVVAEKKGFEKKHFEKAGRKNGASKSLESPSGDPCRDSFCPEDSGRLRYEIPTISSSVREQSNRKNTFLRFSSERKSAGDFRSTRCLSEKKSLEFSPSDEKFSPEFLGSFYSRRRMTDPARPRRSLDASSGLTRSHASTCAVNDKLISGSSSTPSFCIKDMTAFFEKREGSKTNKQYLSSV